jgi:thymidylate synthase
MPCTLSLVFQIRDNKLQLSVTMRSNDIIWGFCNDSYVFTLLQEYVANDLGIEMGEYVHHSISMHIYERHFDMLHSDFELTEFKTLIRPKLKYSTFWSDFDLYLQDALSKEDFNHFLQHIKSSC